MSDNKTLPTSSSVDDFIAAVKNTTRRNDAIRLKALMEEITGEPAVMWGPSIVGFGVRHYRYESGREGDMPAVGFSPRASSLSLYINGATDEHEGILQRLGKHKAGAACIYVNKLADIDEDVLTELIEASLQD